MTPAPARGATRLHFVQLGCGTRDPLGSHVGFSDPRWGAKLSRVGLRLLWKRSRRVVACNLGACFPSSRVFFARCGRPCSSLSTCCWCFLQARGCHVSVVRVDGLFTFAVNLHFPVASRADHASFVPAETSSLAQVITCWVFLLECSPCSRDCEIRRTQIWSTKLTRDMIPCREAVFPGPCAQMSPSLPLPRSTCFPFPNQGGLCLHPLVSDRVFVHPSLNANCSNYQ